MIFFNNLFESAVKTNIDNQLFSILHNKKIIKYLVKYKKKSTFVNAMREVSGKEQLFYVKSWSMLLYEQKQQVIVRAYSSVG